MNKDKLIDNLKTQLQEILSEGEAVLNEDLAMYSEELAQRTIGALLEGDQELVDQLASIPEMLATASGIAVQRRTQERLQEGILWSVRLLVGAITPTL